MILNEDELALIQDKHFFELKQSALQKIENELALLSQSIKDDISNNQYNFPENKQIHDFHEIVIWLPPEHHL